MFSKNIKRCSGSAHPETAEIVCQSVAEAARAAVNQKIPVGRKGAPNEIGGICVFLASQAASYINGATVWADGEGGFS